MKQRLWISVPNYKGDAQEDRQVNYRAGVNTISVAIRFDTLQNGVMVDCELEYGLGMTAKFHLMIVDDELNFLESVAMLLEMEGFQVSVHDDPRLAVAAVCDGFTPDLVMLDFRMPWLNGSQTLKQMRGCGLRAPIVLVSAMASLAAESAANGFDAALSKPFAIDEMVCLVRRLLSGATASRAGMAS